MANYDDVVKQLDQKFGNTTKAVTEGVDDVVNSITGFDFNALLNFDFQSIIFTIILAVIGIFILISASQGIKYYDYCGDTDVKKGSMTNKKALLVFKGIGLAFLTQVLLETLIGGSWAYIVIGLVLSLTSFYMVGGFKTQQEECNVQKTAGEKGTYFFMGMGVGLIILILFTYIVGFAFDNSGELPSIDSTAALVFLSILLIVSASVSMSGYKSLQGDVCKKLFTKGEQATYTTMGFGVATLVMTIFIIVVESQLKLPLRTTIFALTILGLIMLTVVASFALNTYYRCEDRTDIGSTTLNWIFVIGAPLGLVGLGLACYFTGGAICFG